jgi:site-specific DNA-cytosine methylase
MFKDIITGGHVERVKALALLESESRVCTSQESIKKRASKEFINIIYENKTYQINESKESNGVQPYMQNRIYDVNGKSPCLTKEKAHYLKYQTSELIYEVDNELRCKTNTNKGFDVVTENDCLDLSYPTSTTRRSRVTKGKAPCLTESNNNLYSYKDGIVRTVNKVEMCRLQGFPDNYVDILSDNKAGSLLGDGWTLPVIEHIFRYIKK